MEERKFQHCDDFGNRPLRARTGRPWGDFRHCTIFKARYLGSIDLKNNEDSIVVRHTCCSYFTTAEYETCTLIILLCMKLAIVLWSYRSKHGHRRRSSYLKFTAYAVLIRARRPAVFRSWTVCRFTCPLPLYLPFPLTLSALTSSCRCTLSSV